MPRQWLRLPMRQMLIHLLRKLDPSLRMRPLPRRSRRTPPQRRPAAVSPLTEARLPTHPRQRSRRIPTAAQHLLAVALLHMEALLLTFLLPHRPLATPRRARPSCPLQRQAAGPSPWPSLLDTRQQPRTWVWVAASRPPAAHSNSTPSRLAAGFPRAPAASRRLVRQLLRHLVPLLALRSRQQTSLQRLGRGRQVLGRGRQRSQANVR